MMAIQMSVSGTGEHLSGRSCVQNLQSRGSICSTMKRPLLGLRGPGSPGWKSGKRRASLEDSGIFPVWCLFYACITLSTSPRTPVSGLQMLPRNPQPREPLAFPRIASVLHPQLGHVNRLTQRPLWHHACLPTSSTEGGKEDTLPKTPEETVAKGTQVNFQYSLSHINVEFCLHESQMHLLQADICHNTA